MKLSEILLPLGRQDVPFHPGEKRGPKAGQRLEGLVLKKKIEEQRERGGWA